MQIGSMIARAARQFGDAPCLTEGTRSIGFREFDDATNRLGNSLLASGLKPGDRAGVMLPNSIDCLVTYYAIAKCGLIRVGLNPRDTVEDHIYKLGESGWRALIHNNHETLSEEVELSIGPTRLTSMITNGDSSPCAIERDLDAPFRLGFTGGTTGKPKAVTLTSRGELSELSAFLTDLVPDVRQGDLFLHAAPIAHASGAFFLPALCRGGQSIIMQKFDAAEFVSLAEKTQANMTFLVPTMLAMILEVPNLNDARLNFRRICYGASPISQSLLQRAEQRFGRVFAQCYGQAESPMVITCLKPEDHDRVGSCGRPFVIADVTVLDEADKPLPAGEIGEICVRGPQLMAYYWNKPEATAEVMRNGWLHTGDIGKMDEHGFFFLLDRKNDMLISGGYNVYPREVEDVLLSFDGVIEAGVIGIPDEKWGDRIHAVVAGRSGLDSGAVLAWAKERLADYKRPKAVEIWSELPKSAANKVLRRKIREIVTQRDRIKEPGA